MYAPTGKVIVMQSGKKPVTVPRYDILKSKEYNKFITMTSRNNREINYKEN